MAAKLIKSNLKLSRRSLSKTHLLIFALIFAVLGGGYLLLRSQAATPPLKWAPPGYDGSGNPDDPANYPGYNVINAPTGSGTLNLDDNKDYFVNLGHAQWSSYPFTTNGNRTSIQIAGGRNVVIIGGKITFNSTNKYDDQTCLQIDDGNAEGTVHIEGVEMQCVNGITIRTKRTVQLENDRITVRTYNDDHTYNHPDVIQVWDRGPANAIRINRLSAYSTYTGLSNLLTPAPLVWENYQVDIHALPPLDGSLPSIMGAFVYHNSGNTPPSGPFTQWKGSDLWVETGYYNLSWRRKLDDVGIGKYLANQQGYTTNIGWPYELYPGPGQSGTKYTSPAVPTSGSSCATNPCDLGRRQGDRLTFERVPEIEEEWNWGKAPTSTGADSNGNFVPAGYAGTSYVSPGYVGTSTGETLPFPEASLRVGYATLTVPATQQNVTCPAGNDCLIDLQNIKRTVGSLLIWGSADQNIKVINGYWEITKPIDDSPYWRGGPRIRSVDGVGPAHVSLTDMYISGTTLADSIAIAASPNTKVTLQRIKTDYLTLNTPEPTEHVDAVQVQGPVKELNIGQSTIGIAGVVAPNDRGKGFMLKKEGAAAVPFTVNVKNVNFRPRGNTGANIFQDSRDIKVNLDNVWTNKADTEGCVWSSGSCLFYPNAPLGSTYSWYSTGTAPNRLADWPDASGVFGQVREGVPAGGDFYTATFTPPTPPPPLPPPTTPPPPPPPTSCSSGQFLAKYFANTSLSGTPVITGCETSINDNWGAGSPDGLPADGFSASWDGSFAFEAGTYDFTATVDDGVRLYVDGQLLIDKWFRQAPTTYTASKALTAGSHQVKVEYYEEVGGATIQAGWAKQATTATPGDTNGDNQVDITDLSILLSNWNTSYQAADFNSDGSVNILDLSILLSNYGT